MKVKLKEKVSVLIGGLLAVVLTFGSYTEAKANRKVSLIADIQVEKLTITAVDTLKLIQGTYIFKEAESEFAYTERIINLQLTNNRIKINNLMPYEYYTENIKGKSVICFGAVSEDTGDWLGGGTIEIFNDKIVLIIYTGPAKEEKSLYIKKRS